MYNRFSHLSFRNVKQVDLHVSGLAVQCGAARRCSHMECSSGFGWTYPSQHQQPDVLYDTLMSHSSSHPRKTGTDWLMNIQ